MQCALIDYVLLKLLDLYSDFCEKIIQDIEK